MVKCRESVNGIIVGCIIGTIILSGIIALVLSIVNWSTVYLDPATKYGMVFDAGSSHTSLYIYEWPANKENDTGIVSQVNMCTAPGKGISSYAYDPREAGRSLKSCLDKAMNIIPEKQQQETPILLGATAGMRLLSIENGSLADKIIDEVSKTIRQYPMDFQGARTLTGNEEGSLGWITVNYLLQTFITYSFIGKWVHPSPDVVLGAMDLGGASTQITFHPKGQIVDKETEMFFRLYGNNYNVYTHSYLCYGKDQVLKMLLMKLIQNQHGVDITHPCYPKGYTTTISLSSLIDSPCVNRSDSSLPKQVDVTGTGNPEECKNTLRQLFNFSACGTNDCTFDVYQPPVDGQFYAFSAFYYTFSFLNLTNKQSLSTVNSTIYEFCAKDWKMLNETYLNEGTDRLLNYCATGMYIFTLLVDKYKFGEQTWSNIIFAKQAGNADIGWTLGYMLNLTNKIPSEASVEYIGRPQNLWVAALFFITLSVAAALVALVILMRS